MPFANNQGTSIFYKVEGRGPPLVMIHGGLGSHEAFVDYGYVAALRETHQLILIDMRGFGQSDKPHQANGYTLKKMVEDIVVVMDDLEIDRFHIYGHSMGGWLVYGLAIYFPECLKSIILSDGVPGSGDSGTFREFSENLDEIVAQWEGLSPAVKERVLANDRRALSAIAAWLAEELPSMIKEINAVVDKIKVPTLILMSNLDAESEEYQLLRKTEAAIPHASLVVFEDLSHSGLFRNSDKVLPHIKKFLKSI